MEKGLLAPIMLLLLFSLASFVQASDYELEISQVGGKIVEKHAIHLDSEEIISLELPSDAYSISSNLNYSILDSKLILTGKDMEVSYLTQNSLEKVDDGYFYVNKIALISDFNKSRISLILDEGYFTEKGRIFPEPSSISSDGQQIMLGWTLENTKSGEDVPIFVSIKSPRSDAPTFSIWALVIALTIYAVYFFYSRISKKSNVRMSRKPKSKKKSVEKKADDAERYLMESEKAVITALRGADRGEMWQKQIQLATGFSKAKLSRVIRNLESRSLVEKIPFGNTNKVRLK